jgi:hypothetical protein
MDFDFGIRILLLCCVLPSKIQNKKKYWATVDYKKWIGKNGIVQKKMFSMNFWDMIYNNQNNKDCWEDGQG